MLIAKNNLQLLSAYLIGLRPVCIVLLHNLRLLDYPLDLFKYDIVDIDYDILQIPLAYLPS
jgi:hypothetical protein